jgi:uncharacterized protein (DUF1501 family)
MTVNRRVFVKGGAMALVALGLPPAFLPRYLLAETPTRRARRKTLVTIFQRGAVDGLNMVVPFGESGYYRLRRSIAVPPPTQSTGPAGAIDLDGFFGLHPSLQPLQEIWTRKELAIVHAVGSPHPTRSHFDAQDFMESGTPGVKETRDGWLNRVLQETRCNECSAAHAADHAIGQSALAQSPFRGIALTKALPRSLQGPASTLATPDLTRFGVSDASLESAFAKVYASPQADIVATAGNEAFEAAASLKKLLVNVQPRAGVQYIGELGNSLRQIAQLIKADVGLEVAFTDVGGWDTHSNQGGSNGTLATRLNELGRGIRAFYDDLGDLAEDVVVMTMSEFGRTVAENGSGGTDHGHANCMMILGGSVAGGKIYGKWPGLEPEQLFEKRDLAITTDFRDVFAEVASKHLGTGRLERVFPDYTVDPARFRGLI